LPSEDFFNFFKEARSTRLVRLTAFAHHRTLAPLDRLGAGRAFDSAQEVACHERAALAASRMDADYGVKELPPLVV
jgi:hypothetical protein